MTAGTLDALGMSRKQIASVATSTARVNVWTGSVRSGKTIASLLRWLAFVATAPAGGNLVMVGRTRESVARNIFQPLQDPTLFGPLAMMVSYTPGAPTATILGRTIDVMGAHDVRSEFVLRGLTVAGAYVDEATLVSETFWTQLLARMSVPGAMLFATTNPDGPAHWFKKTVIDRAAELGYRVFHFTLPDNTWLTAHNPEYVKQIMREYVGLWYRRFILGHWVQAEGAVYDMWDETRHVIPADALPPMDRVLALGVDHGTTNPTRGYLLGIAAPLGVARLYVLDEWAPPVGLTDGAQSTALRAWMGSRPVKEWGAPQWWFIDPAAASFKVQLFNDGVSSATNAQNDVVPGIRTVASLLGTNRLLVSSACWHLIEQIPGYSWDPKATARGDDAPIKVDDHEVDALRYAVHSSRAYWLGAIPLAPAGPAAPGIDEEA